MRLSVLYKKRNVLLECYKLVAYQVYFCSLVHQAIGLFLYQGYCRFHPLNSLAQPKDKHIKLRLN